MIERHWNYLGLNEWIAVYEFAVGDWFKLIQCAKTLSIWIQSSKFKTTAIQHSVYALVIWFISYWLQPLLTSFHWFHPNSLPSIRISPIQLQFWVQFSEINILLKYHYYAGFIRHSFKLVWIQFRFGARTEINQTNLKLNSCRIEVYVWLVGYSFHEWFRFHFIKLVHLIQFQPQFA